MKIAFERLLVLLWVAVAIAATPAGGLAQSGSGSLADAVREAQEAGVPPTALNGILTLAYETQLEPSAMVSLVGRLARVQKEGFPVQPFVSKIEEGLTKRVPAPLIGQVVDRKLDDYRHTRALLEDFARRYGQTQPVPEEYLVRVTESLYCGLSRQELDHILGQAPATSVPVLARGVEVSASLKQVGFDPKLSDQIVFKGLERSFFTPEQRDFSRIIGAAKARGISDQAVAAAALASIEANNTAGQLCTALGMSAKDLGHHGPQVGKGTHGTGAQGHSGGSMGQHGGSLGGGSHGSGGSHGGGHGGGGGSGGGGCRPDVGRR